MEQRLGKKSQRASILFPQGPPEVLEFPKSTIANEHARELNRCGRSIPVQARRLSCGEPRSGGKGSPWREKLPPLRVLHEPSGPAGHGDPNFRMLCREDPRRRSRFARRQRLLPGLPEMIL